MRLPILFLSAAILLGGCGQSPRCANDNVESLVGALNPKEQFRSMLTSVVERTQTAQLAISRDSTARQKMQQAVDEAVERHGAEWERNLVTSWQALSPAEVGLACTALNTRDQTTFTRFTQRVGPQVQTLNEPLLRRAARDVLEAVW